MSFYLKSTSNFELSTPNYGLTSSSAYAKSLESTLNSSVVIFRLAYLVISNMLLTRWNAKLDADLTPV